MTAEKVHLQSTSYAGWIIVSDFHIPVHVLEDIFDNYMDQVAPTSSASARPTCFPSGHQWK